MRPPVLDRARIKKILSENGPMSFYRLAEEMVTTRNLSDFHWIALLAQDLERELPSVDGVTIENGLVSISAPPARLDECPNHSI